MGRPAAALFDHGMIVGTVKGDLLDRLLERYRGLAPDARTALRLKAMIGGDTNKSLFVVCMGATGTKGPDGRAWSFKTVNSVLEQLRSKGLVSDQTSCVGPLLHPVTVDAMAASEGGRLLDAVFRTFPADGQRPYYPYSIADDEHARRRFRLAIYADNAPEYGRLMELYAANPPAGQKPHPLAALFRDTPVEPSWLSSRALDIQYGIFAVKLTHFLETGLASADLAALIDHYRRHEEDPDYGAFKWLLLHSDILAGRLGEARRKIEGMNDDVGHVRLGLLGSLAFLEGRNAEAIERFRESLRLYKRHCGRRKVFFNASNGLFFLMALLKTGDAGLHGEIQSSLDAVDRESNMYGAGFDALQALLWVMEGLEPKAREMLEELRADMPGEVLSAACVTLAEYFLEPATALHYAKETAARFTALKETLPLVARVHAEVLAQVTHPAEPYCAFLKVPPGATPTIAFTEIVQIRMPWERAFDSLSAALRLDSLGTAPAAARSASRRLVWFLDPESKSIEVAEQSAKARDGWSAGRAIAMKRLQEQDPRLDYLTDHDRRALRTIRKDVRGWYNEELYDFDPYRTILALVGHPLVFDARRREQKLELVSYPVELVVTEKRDGYKIALSHAADEPAVFLEPETANRHRVIDVSQPVLKLQEILGRGGLTVPRQAKERVVTLLKEQNLSLPVRADIAAVELPSIEAQATPVLQMQPWEDGLKVAMVVRPFGAAGPYYLAGHGGPSVLAVIEGQRQRANRDLAAERSSADAVLAALPTLHRSSAGGSGSSAGGSEWLLGDLGSALEFLLEVKACPLAVSVEWPEGEKLRISPPVTAAAMALKLTRARDWFQIEGEVRVDEDLVLDMQDLLGRLGKAPGRFVPLGDGRFLALTREFQAQLERLLGVSEEDHKGRRLAPLGTVAVQDLVEEAGSVEADRHWRAFVDRLRAATAYDPVVPSTLQAELRDYQIEGFRWLSRLAHWGAGACLADDMGLGKTVQAIAVMLEQAPHGPCLVLAPTSVCHNWESELARFAPALSVRRLGATPNRAEQLEAVGPMDVLVASYGLMHLEADRLADVEWRMVVLDEAQAIKNAATKRAQACQRLTAAFRLALTGTPVENYLDELWSLFNIVNPGLLGSRERFQRRFAGPIERKESDRDHSNGALQSLRALIRPFILRRTKSAVLSELPPRTEVTLEVDLPAEERAFYEALRRKALEALSGPSDGLAGQRRIHILAEITRLRRACCHPGLVDPQTELPGAKLETILDLVDELIRNHHKALVFSQFVGHLERLSVALDQRGIRYQYLDGGTPAKDRERQIAAFQAGEGALFLISLKAGGTGLNLTAADYVIHLDPWWNPAVEDQASDRAHRIGQQRPVTVYRLIVQDSIEEKILALHRRKRDLAADLLEGSEMSGRLSDDELLDLIRS